jgi:hypothetical protein
MRASSRSRAQIADNMSGLLGVRVTEKMLNAYSAESMNQYRLPAAWIRAFCCAADDPAVLHAIAQAGEFYLITAQEKSLLDLGRQYLRRKRANEEAELLEKRLAGLDL